mmetsp:Transcript_41440/g.109999  ORF Transcript_41440/g.109999 Transcript_41440/m.109999 type:complete len:152 (+) Transcript_41440:116-571(+)
MGCCERTTWTGRLTPKGDAEGKIGECILWHTMASSYGGLAVVDYVNEHGDPHLGRDHATLLASTVGVTELDCKVVCVTRKSKSGRLNSRVQGTVNYTPQTYNEILQPLGSTPPFSLYVGLFVLEHDPTGTIVKSLTFLRLDERYFLTFMRR